MHEAQSAQPSRDGGRIATAPARPTVKQSGINGFAAGCMILGFLAYSYLALALSVVCGITALLQLQKDFKRGRILVVIGLTFSGLWVIADLFKALSGAPMGHL